MELPLDLDIVGLFGQYDRNLKMIRKMFNVGIELKDGGIIFDGDSDQVDTVMEIFEDMIKMMRKKGVLEEEEVLYIIEHHRNGERGNGKKVADEILSTSLLGSKIKPKTLGQKRYIEAMKTHDIVFSIGPAGTGKTYLAVAMAIDSLKSGKVQRIILTRPAVEAGEKLGYLPGTFMEKVDPYLRPLYDAMFDMMSFDKFQRYRERGIIEIVPLAYMRGRTLNGSFIILDEAQNTTHQQMKMFLTRIGFNSKAIITGDITQIDLEDGKSSGLVEAIKILKGIEGIAFVFLKEEDVVRHPLVKKIIKAYEKYEAKKNR